MPTVPAPLLVLAAAVCTQTGQAFGKQLFALAGPLGVVAARLGFAALILLALHRPGMPRGKAVFAVLALGVAIAGMNLVYPALRYLPVGVASTLQLLGPIAVAVGSSRRPGDLGIVALAGLGVWLVRDPEAGPLPWQGIALALLSAVAMGGYLLAARRVSATVPGGSGLALGVAVAAVLGMPAGLVHTGDVLLDPRVLLAGLAVAVLSAVLPYSLELVALRRLRPGVVAVLLTLEPAVAGLAGLVVLHEVLSAAQWLGIGCVCAATATVTLRQLRTAVTGGRDCARGLAPGAWPGGRRRRRSARGS